MKRIIVFFLFMVLIVPLLYADEGRQKTGLNNWEITENFVYSRGKYGGNTLTQTAELDTAFTGFFEKGAVSLTIPLVTQTTDSQVTLVRGSAQRIARIRSGKVTNGGIGDIYMNGSYYLLSENKDPIDISLDGYLKFPTASSSKGLGTGEADAGPGISFGKRISPEWRMFTDFYYILIGSPSGLDLRDQTTFDLGASYDFSSLITGSVTYEESRSVLKGTENPEDLALGIKYKVNDTTRLFGGMAFGLSNTAADFSMNIGAGIKF
jgi:hypothetical protein